MNGSVGMDLAEISRIRKAMENPRFLLEFFTENERAYITARHTPEQSAAGAWAAKEAFSKAVGTGVRGWSLREVEVAARSIGEAGSPAAWTGSTAVFRLCVFTEHQPYGYHGGSSCTGRKTGREMTDVCTQFRADAGFGGPLC